VTPAVKELFKSVNIWPSDKQTFSAVISWSHTVGSQGRKPGTKCGGRPVQGIWGTEVPQWGPGRSPGTGSGGRSPPEAEAILDF